MFFLPIPLACDYISRAKSESHAARGEARAGGNSSSTAQH